MTVIRPDFPRFKIGQRVLLELGCDEKLGTVVAPQVDPCPPDRTPVRYDGDDTIWHTPTENLRPVRSDDNLTALFLCSAILETARRLQSDLDALKKAADEFRTDMEKLAERLS